MRAPVLAAAAWLSACAAIDTPESCRVTHLADIPIELIGSLPFVEAHINGHPATLLLDTGAELPLVRPEAFDRLGLVRDYGATAYVIGVGAQTSNWPSRPATVSLGSIAMPAMPMLVASLPFQLPDGRDFDGVLSAKMLATYDVDLDMPGRRLGLNERRRCPGGAPPFAGGGNVVAVQGVHADLLNIPFVLDGVPVQALLDTGASQTTVDPANFALPQAELARDRRISFSGVGPVGVSGRLHRFGELKVGTETLRRPLVFVAPFRLGALGGVLGTDYWREHRAWISYGSRTVTIGPSQPRPR